MRRKWGVSKEPIGFPRRLEMTAFKVPAPRAGSNDLSVYRDKKRHLGPNSSAKPSLIRTNSRT